MIRKKILFAGRVQGVGFRYTAYHAAVALGLTGWVHNEWDGTVSMEVQGREETIDALILRLQSARYIEIERMEVKHLSPDIKERSFEVR